LLSLKTDVNVLTESIKQKNLGKNLFSLHIESKKAIEEKGRIQTGSGSLIQWYGSADPEPYQNVMYPETLHKNFTTNHHLYNYKGRIRNLPQVWCRCWRGLTGATHSET
jgi:hypothetical protein